MQMVQLNIYVQAHLYITIYFCVLRAVQMRALTAMHQAKVKTLMDSITTLKSQVAVLQGAQRENKRRSVIISI